MKTPIPIFFFFFFFTILWFNLPPCFSDDEFRSCNVNYNCGELADIGYPFWGNERHRFCGRREFELNCKDNKTTTIEISSTKFNVLNISQPDHRMRIARSDLFDDYCPRNPIETATLDRRLFNYSSSDLNISVWYDCTPQQEILEDFRFWCGSVGGVNGSLNYAVGEHEMEARNLSVSINGECKLKLEVTVTKWVMEEEEERNRTAWWRKL